MLEMLEMLEVVMKRAGRWQHAGIEYGHILVPIGSSESN